MTEVRLGDRWLVAIKGGEIEEIKVIAKGIKAVKLKRTCQFSSYWHLWESVRFIERIS